MRITELFEKQKRTFSFEFFPPKDNLDSLALGETIGELRELNPSFISVTYGAGGSTQRVSFDICNYTQNRLGIPTMAHYTCVGATAAQLGEGLDYLKGIGIENLMLLRGDPPKGQTQFQKTSGGFDHAVDLVRLARGKGDFSIGVAGYPEKHLESPDWDKDMDFLKDKVEAGGDFIVTQLFFDNTQYFRFVASARKRGIQKRIIPGIMPITNFKQIRRMADMCGASVPENVVERLAPIQDDPKKIYQEGVALAVKQCKELLAGGAPGIHFYTLNKSHATMEIFKACRFETD